MEWIEDKPLDELTISDLENICQHAFHLKGLIENLEAKIEEHKAPLQDLQKKIEACLTGFGKTSWDSKYGKVEIRQKTSVKIPRTDEDKAKLFDWLKQKGIFWQYVSVNSMSLNSLYKAEADIAFAEGKDCVLPGVGAPEVYSQVILKGK